MESLSSLSEQLRQVMRCWSSGVAVVTSWDGSSRHGMTVNSFTSVSLNPPLVTVTLANGTRTHALVARSGVFAVTILAYDQRNIADRFAGRIPEDGDRFAGVATRSLASGAPLIEGGLAFLDCRVIFSYPMEASTLFIGQVVQAAQGSDGAALLYRNREYHRMEP